MWLLTLILLVLLGILGISPWLKEKRPDTSRHMQPIEQFEGWIGVAGLVWGLLLLLRWLAAIGVMRFAAGGMLVTLVTALVVLGLSLLLALPLLHSMFGSGTFMEKISQFAERLRPYRIGFGFACLVLALYTLLGRAI